jgi:hypothetical protein
MFGEYLQGVKNDHWRQGEQNEECEAEGTVREPPPSSAIWNAEG